ncbi:tRNA (adenosine(37)-N6)-threonylcarbamoyltransferase complex ATPase subunit type 1 TsaE [Thiovibrio sp. JS02]
MPDDLILPLPDLAATARLGRYLGEIARPGDVITLSGSLGAGKTTLTQAIGQGLQVPESCYITSPTFSLMHEYPGRLPLYHMDLYRLTDETEIEELGFEEYFHGAGLTVIEWPDRLGSLMPGDRLEITMDFQPPASRQCRLTVFGPGWRERIGMLKEKG